MLGIQIREDELLIVGDAAIVLLDKGNRGGRFARLGITAPREMQVELKKRRIEPQPMEAHDERATRQQD